MMKKLNPPEENRKNLIYNILKEGTAKIAEVGFGAIGGVLASEIFSSIFSDPITKRREKWMVAVVEKLYELENFSSGFIEKLKNNDEFISFVLECSQIASKTHQDEKIKVLKNTIRNFFILESVEYDKKYSFLKVIDEISPTHLKILQFMFKYAELIKKHELTFPQLHEKYEELDKIDKYFFRKCITDLDNLFLIRYHKADYFSNQNPLGEFTTHPKITNFGEEFLKFIDEN